MYYPKVPKSIYFFEKTINDVILGYHLVIEEKLPNGRTENTQTKHKTPTPMRMNMKHV